MKYKPYSRIFFFFLFVFLLSSIILIVHNVQAGETNTVITEIDSDGNVGLGTSIAVNSAGQIVIAYFDYDNLDLKLAVCEDRHCTGNPQIVTVDSDGGVGKHPNIRIAQDDRPVISYYDTTNRDLKLAVCNDPTCTSATLQVVDAIGNVGNSNSLALDNNGRPVISYYDDTNQRLKLAVCNNLICTAPNLVMIDDNGDPGVFSSVEVDENGRIVIAYYEAFNGDLLIAFCNNAACNAPTIKKLDAINNAGLFPSMEIVDGRIFVSYFRMTPGGLDVKVAQCDDLNCNALSIKHVINLDPTLYNSMVMDDQGQLFISFWDMSNSDLIVAACNADSILGCKEGTFTRVDHKYSTGQYPDITLDNQGVPIISYYDAEEQALNLASCPLCRVPSRNDIGAAAGWNSTSLVVSPNNNPIITYQDANDNNFYLTFCEDPECDTFNKTSLGGGLHIDPSMALQPNGRPAVSYFQGLTSELKYTVCHNNNCTNRTTNVIVSAGLDPSLQFDSNGLPVIAYYDANGKNLNLARCNDIECSAPQLSPVDTGADVGRFASMELTSENYPVISYYDINNNSIKFAICDDESCSTPVIKNTVVNTGPYNELALSEDGTPFIAMYNNNSQTLRILICNDATCDFPGISALDDTSTDTGWDISMVMSQDDTPIVSYYDAEIGALRLATCHTQACVLGSSLGVIDILGGDSGRFSHIALNNEGDPVIAYTDQTTPSARVLVFDTGANLYEVFAPVVIGN